MVLGARQSFGRQAVPFGLLYAMLALLAGLCLLGAAVALMYLDGSVRSLSLSVLGGVFLSVIVVIGVFLLDRRRNRVTWRAAMALMADDQTPCFITSETGFVVAQNNAAVAKFGSQTGKSLAHILTSVSPTLTRSLERLETALLRDAHVSEAITTPRVSVALNGHRLGRGVFWRLDFEKTARAEAAAVSSYSVEKMKKSRLMPLWKLILSPPAVLKACLSPCCIWQPMAAFWPPILWRKPCLACPLMKTRI